MDRKSIIILVLCFLMLAGWMPLMNWLYPPPPRRAASDPAVAAARGTNAAVTAENPVPIAPNEPVMPASAPHAFLTAGVPEVILELTNDLARYTFSSHGGGLKGVELLKFPETVGDKNTTNAGSLATLNSLALAPVLATSGGSTLEGDGVFQLTRTKTSVRAEKTLTNGLVLVKTFALGTNYLLSASVSLTNTSAQPLSLPNQSWIIGTATPMSPLDDGLSVGMLWFDRKASTEIGQSWFDNRFLGCFPGTPRFDYRGGQTNVIWAAVHNQFFALAAMPETPADEVLCHPVQLARPMEWTIQAPTKTGPLKGFETALVYPAQTLAPGQGMERRFYFFAGPKEYRVLDKIGSSFGNEVEQVMGFSGFFGWFAKVLLLSMNGLQSTLHVGYGWAIVFITIIIKLLFWPLTQASTRSMKRMQALQPQMNAIKEKYKDDSAKMNQKLMEYMKENKVSPLGGCLPMLIQLPIFFGFYRMIQSAIELRGERFLWVADLAKPDTLFQIHMGAFDIPFNLLPLLMGGTMLWQSHITPATPGADPMQQKMMKYMPLMFLFMLYNFSAGLTLYWTVQNLLSILQMKLTRTQPATVPAVVAPAQKAHKGRR